MSTPLRVLIIEDSERDTKLLLRELRKGGYEPDYERVETAEAMKAALEQKIWDIVISDYSMPQFDAIKALVLFKKKLNHPFIFSGP